MREKLFLIDGHAHIYQAFYAIRGLSGPDGEPVNAVFGFARMLERIRRDYAPQYLAVAMDAAGKVFRHRIYPDYKANRKPMPDELERQLPLIEELLDVEFIPTLSVEGYEADDVMGTVARLAAERGVDTVLVTTDKDAEQLIDERTSILHIRRDGEEWLDRDALRRRRGLEPWQVIELMALSGDASDNVPGVPGVGPKTAAKLIERFGSVEGVYDNIQQIQSNSLRRKLLENRHTVELSKKLVVIDRSVPIELDLERCRTGRVDRNRAVAFYRALDFRSLLDEEEPERDAAPSGRQRSLFSSDGAAPGGEGRLSSIATLSKDYHTVRTAEGVAALAEQLRAAGTFAVDLETTSIRPREAELVGLAFSWTADQGVYVAVKGPHGERVCEPQAALRLLGPVLEDESLGKVGQNLKYDMVVLKNYGIELRGLQCDTMVASYLLNPSGRAHNLDALARRYLGYRTVEIEELIGRGREQRSMDRVPVGRVAPYACEDADVALQLSHKLIPMLKGEQLWELFVGLELPLVPVLAQMEWCGVKVDQQKLAQISGQFQERLAQLEEQIFALAGERFNVNSTAQTSRVLFDKLKLPAPANKKRQTGYSTDSSVLEGLQAEHPIARCLLQHRELSKLKSTYADALRGLINPHTGRVHASFNQTVTATGRLSSSDPNLQNIPVRTPLGGRIRSCFVPAEPDMSLLSADYSQVELRILAHCSGDEQLSEAFRADSDIHAFVAAQVNGVAQEDVTPQMRRQAKAVNFGIVYGQKAYGLSRQLGVPVDEASRFIREYFRRYPGVKKFIGRTISEARRNGYVKTLGGRRRAIAGIRSRGVARSAAERIAVNTVIQGSAADLIKKAMIEIDRDLKGISKRARMLIQIHDELLFEVPDADIEAVRDFVTAKMNGAMQLAVPLKVDTAVGKNWQEAK